MKPDFALSLSPDGIRLLYRGRTGWQVVGEVSPQAATLKSDLARLQQKGARLDSKGVGCKIVIPNQQVRYLTIQTAGFDAKQVRQAAYDALNGATPYAMTDLVFDVVSRDDVTHIAAVARETLEEAEAFALEHGFDPICFAAVPAEDAFAWEPFFGTARAAIATPTETETETETEDGKVIAPPLSTNQKPVDTINAENTSPVASLRDKPLDALGDAEPRGDTPQVVRDTADAPAAEHSESMPEFTSRRRNAKPTKPAAAPKPRKPVPMAGGFAEAPAPFEGPTPHRDSRTPPNAARMTDEAERLTIFGARSQSAAKTEPRPMALLAAGVALVAVLGFAGFATSKFPELVSGLFHGEQTGDFETTAIQMAPPLIAPDQEGSEPTNAPVGGDDTASLTETLTDEDAAVLNALRAPLATPSEEEANAPPTEDFLAKYAVSGIWPRAPEVPSPPPLVDIEDLYVTSIDPIEPAFDAVALPQLETVNRDSAIDAPPSPAPAGTTFELDDRGLVIARPDGTVSPDGVTVFSGAPPVRPANLPERKPSEATGALDPERASLASLRPQLRPGDIVETTERATLDGLTRSELAQIRPPLRPASSTDGNAAAASLVPLDEVEAAQSSEGAVSGVAVVTLRPDIRPDNFSQIVARSQSAAATPAPSTQTASIAPRAVVSPSIPSNASVTREATVRNAINLRKVNLIGVYGTPSQRRALVRLANGRYKKVEVGDRIDGGNISAIGEGELRYQKSGRNIILKMPKG